MCTPLLLLLALLCSFFWGGFSFSALGVHRAGQTLPQLCPASLLLKAVFLTQKEPVLLFHAVPYSTDSVLPLDCQFLTLDVSFFFFLRLRPVTADCTEQCAVYHTLTLAPRHRALCHGKLEGKGNPVRHDLGIKGAVLPSNSEKSWCSSHASYTRETRLSIMSRHPFQVLMTDSKTQQTKRIPSYSDHKCWCLQTRGEVEQC